MGEAALQHQLHGPSRGRGYERHRPEETVRHRTVSRHWPAFLERAREHGGLPRFVVREVLRCGLLEHGCVRVACSSCAFERLVAFSFERRGFCPSCLGRRMADLAVQLEQRVFPEVPVRQRVCSMPWSIRGAYVREGPKGPLVFHALPAPSREEVEGVAARTAERVAKVFRKHGRSVEAPWEEDPLPDTEPALASCYAAAAGGLAVSGARAGRPLLRLVDPRLSRPDELVGEASGFNVHATEVLRRTGGAPGLLEAAFAAGDLRRGRIRRRSRSDRRRARCRTPRRRASTA